MTYRCKKINAAWFSPTGTTKKVVSKIAETIQNNLEYEKVFKISFTLPEERETPLAYQESDIVILGVPVYAGRIPNILLEYLETIRGNGARAVPVVLYGNRDYDDALIELYDIMKKRGFRIIAAGACIGEHSFSKDLAKGRPDEYDMGKINDFSLKVSNKIREGDLDSEIGVTGNRPYISYYRPEDTSGKFYDFRKIKPKTSHECSRCMLCVSICPMGSIDPGDISKFSGICIKCGACTKSCPVRARYYDDSNYLKHQHELEEEFKSRKEPEFFL